MLTWRQPRAVALTVSLIGPASLFVFTQRPMMRTAMPPSAPSNVSKCYVRVSVAWYAVSSRSVGGMGSKLDATVAGSRVCLGTSSLSEGLTKRISGPSSSQFAGTEAHSRAEESIASGAYEQ